MPPRSGFPARGWGVGVGVEGVGGICSGRCCPLPTARHPRFPPLFPFCLSEKEGQASPLPSSPPPRCPATFAVSKLSHHVGTLDPRPAERRAAPTGSGPGILALVSSPRPRRPCPRSCHRPPVQGEATLAATAAPSPPRVLLRGPGEAGAAMRDPGRRLAPPVDVAPGLQCSALAKRPGPPAH